MMVLWSLSSISGTDDGTLGGIPLPETLQNALHVPAFAVLGTAWLWAFGRSESLVNPAAWAFGLATVYGAIDELHQAFVPGRMCSASDAVLDAVGAALAIALMTALRRKRRILNRPTTR